MANAPEFSRGFSELNGSLRANNHLGPRTTELVRLAVAQTTRCTVVHGGPLTRSDADKAALRQHFDPEQVVELALFSVLCMVGRFTMLVGLEEESCPI
jgi:AhpD family alkylhydroperoxidase